MESIHFKSEGNEKVNKLEKSIIMDKLIEKKQINKLDGDEKPESSIKSKRILDTTP